MKVFAGQLPFKVTSFRNVEQWSLEEKKKKSKAVLCRPGGSRGMAPLIPNPCTRPIWMVIFTPRLLFPWEQSPRYNSNKALDGPQRCRWRFGEKQVCRPCRKWDDSSVARPVVWLSRLLMDKYWGCENLLPLRTCNPTILPEACTVSGYSRKTCHAS